VGRRTRPHQDCAMSINPMTAFLVIVSGIAIAGLLLFLVDRVFSWLLKPR